MGRRTSFAVGEWYHCYNRGTEKRKIFSSRADYLRFWLLMYISNGTRPVHLSNLKEKSFESIGHKDPIDRGKPLVEVGAYCLMPNHIHFVVKEICEGGIARYMQKIFTGYTMYFNKKNERTGGLFESTYKAKHVGADRYLKHLVSYVHLNPAELFDSRWKDGHADKKTIETQLMQYPYSSVHEFMGAKRPEGVLVADTIFEMYESIPPFAEIIAEAQGYYEELGATSISKPK
ncbi:MAG: transposase [Candidatus Paceibacterota bacterium]